MSAWIVSKEHIDRIVTAASAANMLPRPGSENEVGRMLWRENLASVAYRYPRDRDGNRPGPGDFRDADVDTYVWTPTDVITGNALRKTLACLSYQSCEHPGWEESEAWKFIEPATQTFAVGTPSRSKQRAGRSASRSTLATSLRRSSAGSMTRLLLPNRS